MKLTEVNEIDLCIIKVSHVLDILYGLQSLFNNIPKQQTELLIPWSETVRNKFLKLSIIVWPKCLTSHKAPLNPILSLELVTKYVDETATIWKVCLWPDETKLTFLLGGNSTLLISLRTSSSQRSIVHEALCCSKAVHKQGLEN